MSNIQLSYSDWIGQPRVFFNVESLKSNINNNQSSNYLAMSNCILHKPNVEDQNRIIVEGNSFIIDLLELNYYHFIETLAQYFLIKKDVEDLMLVIIERNPYSESELPKFGPGLISLIDKKDYLFLKSNDYTSILFENIFYINTKRINLLLEISQYGEYNKEEQEIVKDIMESKNQEIGLDITNRGFYELKKYLKDIVKKQELNKKIFISTKSVNDKIRLYKKFLDVLDNRDMYTEEEFQESFRSIQFHSMGTVEQMRVEVSSRYISEEDEQKVLLCFEKLGYKVIDPVKLEMLEQITLYRESSHIATFSGSSCLASIFCDDDTKFIIINNNHTYEHPHEVYVSYLLKNVLSIFERKDNTSIYSIDDVIEYINNISKDLM
jgi:hypothetical protein